MGKELEASLALDYLQAAAKAVFSRLRWDATRDAVAGPWQVSEMRVKCATRTL